MLKLLVSPGGGQRGHRAVAAAAYCSRINLDPAQIAVHMPDGLHMHVTESMWQDVAGRLNGFLWAA